MVKLLHKKMLMGEYHEKECLGKTEYFSSETIY